jgi:hypothetical protein
VAFVPPKPKLVAVAWYTQKPGVTNQSCDQPAVTSSLGEINREKPRCTRNIGTAIFGHEFRLTLVYLSLERCASFLSASYAGCRWSISGMAATGAKAKKHSKERVTKESGRSYFLPFVTAHE